MAVVDYRSHTGYGNRTTTVENRMPVNNPPPRYMCVAPRALRVGVTVVACSGGVCILISSTPPIVDPRLRRGGSRFSLRAGSSSSAGSSSWQLRQLAKAAKQRENGTENASQQARYTGRAPGHGTRNESLFGIAVCHPRPRCHVSRRCRNTCQPARLTQQRAHIRRLL